MKQVKVRNIEFGRGRPKICVPLTGVTFDEIMEQAQAAKKVADVIEWRADYFADILDDEQLILTLLALRDELREIPLLFTFRSKEEGGEKQIFLKEYKHLYEIAVTSKTVDLVDLELNQIESLGTQFVRWVQALDTKVIISNHEFSETPDDSVLVFRITMMEHFGADIAKIAVMPNSGTDVLRLMEVTLKANAFVGIPIITMSMGKLGALSRVSGELTGSVMTFGMAGQASAPGQLPAETLRAMLQQFSLGRMGASLQEND